MKEIIYFSHDANAMNDTKILNMRADYGLEGYGLFWVIIEQLRCEEDYSLPLNKATYRALKVITGTGIDIEKYISDCINEYGLFEASEDGSIFYSCSLKRRMALKNEKKIKRSEAGKKGAEKRWKEDNMSTKNSNAINNNSNAIKKDDIATKNDGKKWQSKVKESKGKESKENNITKLNKTFNYILNNNIAELKAEKNSVDEDSFYGFTKVLENLDFKITGEAFLETIPEEAVLKFKMIYLALYELYFSPYQVYFNKLTRSKVINKLEKTEKYIRSTQRNCRRTAGRFHSIFYQMFAR